MSSSNEPLPLRSFVSRLARRLLEDDGKGRGDVKDLGRKYRIIFQMKQYTGLIYKFMI